MTGVEPSTGSSSTSTSGRRHRQPERGLLLHALGQAADLPLRIELKHLAELLIAFGVELRVDAAVVAHHVRDRRLRK